MKFCFSLVLSILIFPASAQSWQSFPASNTIGNTNGTVVDFYADSTLSGEEGSVIATGFFTTIEGYSSNYVARLNPNSMTWSELGGGLNDAGHALEKINDTLYIVGYEFGTDSNWVYFLDNGNWTKLGKGFYLSGSDPGQFYTCNLFDIIEWNDQIVVCGEFDQNGSDTIYGIAAWDGSKWTRLGSGLSGPMFGQVINPHQLLEWNGDLYVCGNFTHAGDTLVNGIARWDGNMWHPMGQGFNNTVYAMNFYESELYAGGAFDRSGNDTLLMAAKWDGSQWINPGYGFKMNNTQRFGFVHSIETDGDSYDFLVFAGGFDEVVFSDGSSIPAGSIFTPTPFDTPSPHPMDTALSIFYGGLNNDVEAFIWYGTGPLAGGFFNNAVIPAPQILPRIAFLDLIITDLEDRQKGSEVSVYPNPSSTGIINLKADKEDLNWSLMNANLKTIRSGKGKTLETSDLHPGVYFLKLYVGQDYSIHKVLIQ